MPRQTNNYIDEKPKFYYSDPEKLHEDVVGRSDDDLLGDAPEKESKYVVIATKKLQQDETNDDSIK